VLLAGVAGLVYAEVSGESGDRRKVHGTFTSSGQCIDLGRHGRTHYWDCVGTFRSNDGSVVSILTLANSDSDLGSGERVGALVDGPGAREARAASESVWRRWVTIGLSVALLVLLGGMWVSVLRADRGVPPRTRMRGYRPMNPDQHR